MSVKYQVVFHSGSYSKVDDECDSYEQAEERRFELTNDMHICGERNFYYEIKKVESHDETNVLNDKDFNTLCGR